MLKIFLLFLSIHISLFASYKQALSYYQNADYSHAIQAAKSSKKNYSDPNLHLIWAYSAKALGRTEESMSAFERVLLLDPNNTQAQKELDAIYKQTKRDRLLSDTKTSSKKSTFRAHSSLAFGYDDNLAATPDSETLQDYFGDTAQSDKITSSFFRFTSMLDLTYDIGETSGWYTKYILKFYFQNNFDATFYNLGTASFEAGLGYATEAYNIYFPLSYHAVHYLDKDLLSQFRINPKILIPLETGVVLDIVPLYSQNNYNDTEDQVKDDTTYGIEAGAYRFFEKNYLSLHFKYEHHSAINGFPSKYIGANFWTLRFGSKYYFSPEFVGMLDYRFRYGQYDDVVGTTITTRDDNFHQLDTKLLYFWSEQKSLYISDTYTENRSNYPAAVYKKNTLLFGLDFTY